MGGEFRTQTWLGCNGLIAFFLVAGLALAGLCVLLVTAFRLLGQIESAASAARLTDSRNA